MADTLSSSASSITSGTPSTDTRFSAFHLEKTFSHFSDDVDCLMRPTRTYSVGSKPDTKPKVIDSNILDLYNSKNTRVRAFSVGSKIKNQVGGVQQAKNDKDRRCLHKSQEHERFLLNKDIKNNDHVEVDFSKKFDTFPIQNSQFSSDYMEMNAGNVISNNKTLDENNKTVIECDYVQMTSSKDKRDRAVSKPIQITKRKSENCSIGDYSELHASISHSNVDGRTMFPLSLESSIDQHINEKSLTEFTEEAIDKAYSENHEAKITQSLKTDDGDYALLCTKYKMDQSDDNVSIKNEILSDDKCTISPSNYADLYFPQSLTTNTGNITNLKSNEIANKPLYAQIMFSDIKPK